MWLRSGDASATNNVLGFLEDTLAKLAGKRKAGAAYSTD